jgi:hypothetical protein
MTETTTQLPTAEEASPWFDAICELWDDQEAYRRASETARAAGVRRYSESVMHRRYMEYFASIEAGSAGPLFDRPA